ncbi:MAG: XRE family transcriptional regulator [Ruminococcaceae bacterium]|nr:XRE family transcriptional regulator [Oscillospiraceae bacterium]
MGRVSVKEDKSIYQITREEMRDENGKPWSREKAADQIAEIENGRYNYLDKYRLLKIEEETVKITPEDIVALSKTYNKPELRNYYCCHQCDIGQIDAPEVIYKDNVHEILVNMSVSLESVNSKKMRLMEILADGKVDKTEMADLNKILEELEKISMTVEAIQLWCEKMKLLGS